MYPTGELDRLSARKTLLQARIAVRRWEMAVAAAEVARPMATIDRGLQIWHRISPFVKVFGVSLGLLIPRIMARRSKGKSTGRSKFAAFMAALPLIIRGFNMVKQAHAAHVAHRARS